MQKKFDQNLIKILMTQMFISHRERKATEKKLSFAGVEHNFQRDSKKFDQLRVLFVEVFLDKITGLDHIVSFVFRF